MNTVIQQIAPNLSNEQLGLVVREFLISGALTPHQLGGTLRSVLQNAETSEAEVSVKTDVIPEDAVARTALLDTVYSGFENYRRRSVTALARLTGLTETAVLQLIDGNTDFRVSVGRESGNTFVSLTDI